MLHSFRIRTDPPTQVSHTLPQPTHRPQAQIRQEVTSYGAGRPVYLLGESFGGTLCLALAAKLGNFVDRLVLVNPATSFTDSPWPALGPLLTALPRACVLCASGDKGATAPGAVCCSIKKEPLLSAATRTHPVDGAAGSCAFSSFFFHELNAPPSPACFGSQLMCTSCCPSCWPPL